MDYARQIAALFWEFHLAVTRRIEAELRHFAAATEQFIHQLLNERVPPDWRERLTAHLAHWEHEGPGFIVHNREVLEQYIIDWAKAHGIAVFDDLAGTRRDSSPSTDPLDARPRKSPVPANGRAYFDQKLTEAQSHLDEMRRRLEALGAKLDAAAMDESVDIENDVDDFESLIWRYNDAIESARDAWLRDNLSGDDNTRLLGLLTPVSLGLPFFVDSHQMERANRQATAISRRLGQRDVVLHRMQIAATVADGISFVAGIASGVGFVCTAAKRGGRWGVVKGGGGHRSGSRRRTGSRKCNPLSRRRRDGSPWSPACRDDRRLHPAATGQSQGLEVDRCPPRSLTKAPAKAFTAGR